MYDLLHNLEIHGNTSTEKHYEMRLYGALSWIQFYICPIYDLKRTIFHSSDLCIATPVPHGIHLEPSSVQKLFHLVPGKCVKLRGTTSKVQIDWECFDFLAPHLVSDKPNNFYEEVCK